MADNEIRAQIDKLRKTRPARAIELALDLPVVDADAMTAILSFLRDDLKEEARLLEVSKIKGAVTIMKDRNAVAGWLELFVLQLGREGEASTTPSERLSPSPELGEHRPSERGSDAALLPGPGGRCAVGNVHDESTLKCPCGLDRTTSVELASAAVFPPSPEKVADGKAIADYLSGASDALPHGISLAGAAINGSDEIPGAREFVDSLPNASMTIIDAAAYIGDALAPAEQATHDTIDKELAHVTAEPIVDPFAPIPVQTYAPRTPPGGRQVTALDLLTPIDAALLPAHVSFSQLSTVADCGVKFRLQRVEQLPQVPQWVNVGGTTFHRCVEQIESHQQGDPAYAAATLWPIEFEVEIGMTESASGMSRDTFRASQQGRENYDWWRVEGALMLQRYVDWRQGDGAGQQVLLGPNVKPMLEWETTYDVDGVAFKTILDSVWTDATQGMVQGRTAIIRDWKTGSMTPDDRQLCTQAWGLRKAGWQGQILVQFFDARKGTFSEPFDPFERMTWDDVRYFVLSGDAERRLPIPSARPSDFCGGCPVAYACPIMGQRRTAKVAK
jgi:hypothetical protein